MLVPKITIMSSDLSTSANPLFYTHLVPIIFFSSFELLHCGTLYWPLNFHTDEHPNRSEPPPLVLILHLLNFRSPYSPLTCPKRNIGGLVIYFFEMAAPRFGPVAQNITQIFNTEPASASNTEVQEYKRNWRASSDKKNLLAQRDCLFDGLGTNTFLNKQISILLGTKVGFPPIIFGQVQNQAVQIIWFGCL